MAAYEEALAGQPLQIGAARVKPGSIRALAVSYFSSIDFRSMKGNSQYVRRKIIERFCEETDKDGSNGDKSAVTLQREVDPVSWTPDYLSLRSPRWQGNTHAMRRSSAGRW
jgi:hypothetical protein